MAVFQGAHSGCGAECAREVALVVKAAIQGDLSDGIPALFQASASHEQSRSQEVLTGAHGKQPLELTLELAFGEVRACGHFRHGDSLGIAGGDEIDDWC